MKVIDMLDRIAKGEEVKFKIIKTDEVLNLTKDTYLFSITHNEPVEWFIDEEWLNYEVELTEDKKIEKLENEKQFYSYRKYADIKNDIDKILYIVKGLNLTEEKIDNLNNKINEIIDYMNGGTNGK